MKIAILFVWMLVFLTPQAQAGNFNLSTTVGATTITNGYTTAEEVIDAMKGAKISTLFPTYRGTEAVALKLDFRGLPITLNYSAGGASGLVLSIPSIGISQTFSGSTRDISNQLFKDWMKKDGKESLNAILKKLVEVSSSDPLAGNPTSLMNQMVSNDFSQTSQPVQSRSDGGTVNNLVGVGLRAQLTDDGGKKGKSLTVPFSYVVRFDSNPNRQLSFFLPISYSEYESAKSYNASIGVGYRLPILENWAITPSIGTGVVGSIDLGAGGQILSASLSSNLGFDLSEDVSLSMANMAGNYQSVKIKIASYESDPGLNNTVLRNGLLFSFPHRLFGMRAESEIFGIDTRFMGSLLYLKSYEEIGYSLGSDKRVTDLTKFLRAGLSYLFSSKTKGFTFNFGYSF